MRKRKNSKSSKKQLALKLDDGAGDLSPGNQRVSVESERNDSANNVICLCGELNRREKAERGNVYARIMSLASHLG